jgi:hypothetical protein
MRESFRLDSTFTPGKRRDNIAHAKILAIQNLHFNWTEQVSNHDDTEISRLKRYFQGASEDSKYYQQWSRHRLLEARVLYS